MNLQELNEQKNKEFFEAMKAAGATGDPITLTKKEHAEMKKRYIKFATTLSPIEEAVRYERFKEAQARGDVLIS